MGELPHRLASRIEVTTAYTRISRDLSNMENHVNKVADLVNLTILWSIFELPIICFTNLPLFTVRGKSVMLPASTAQHIQNMKLSAGDDSSIGGTVFVRIKTVKFQHFYYNFFAGSQFVY